MPIKAHIQPISFITPPELKAEYANLVRISHSPAEVVLEFAPILTGDANPAVVAKLVMTPLGVKMLQHVLGDSLTRYERTFGEIKLPGPAPWRINSSGCLQRWTHLRKDRKPDG